MKIEVTYSKTNTHVKNSYLIDTKEDIKKEMEYIIEIRKAMRYHTRKRINSYIREWKGHNNLYKLGLFESHTKDVDLEENIPLWKEIIWMILSL